MAKQSKSKSTELTKTKDININKIGVFFKRSILKSIVKILTMEHGGFRTFKTMKNINRLFNNIDMNKYKNNHELESYIWCIKYISKQWLDGIVDVDLIIEMAKRQPEYDNIKGDIITTCKNDPNIISSMEAKMIFDLVAEALQYGYVTAMKEEYINLLDEINLDEPGAFRALVERLFLVSQSLLDIKHSTNMVTNKVEFNTADMDSLKESIGQTIGSLKTSNNIFKTGIRRLNTLLSPGYMNGRIYIYLGLPGAGKSLILLKSALDIRKYNPDFKPKTPGMKPAVLYITMENTFTETIERIWSMSFDEPIINYSEEEALEKLCNELGIDRVLKDDVTVYDVHDDGSKSELNALLTEPSSGKTNIELIMQYYPYRSINTDDLFTIIQDLREENLEVCTLVFDYIKRIEPSVPIVDNPRLELGRIIDELKALAVIQDIPVITAHQMNRSAAATVDAAARQGKGDTNKLVGRENVGDSWSVIEGGDWISVINSEYKPGTDEKYMTFNVVKRRRIDMADAEFAKYTYLAHPFSKSNGLRLIDDINLNKVLSLQSLSSDIDVVGKEKANAVPRLKSMEQHDFVEYDEDDMV
jgi:replicative DNA helicase